MSHYLGDNLALCVNTFGQKMIVDTRDRSVTPHLLHEGKWEMWITEAIAPFCKGAAFIDVGANQGWYSLVAEKHGASRVWAFEPNHELYERCLLPTMWINGYTWKVFPVALSDQREEPREFFVHPQLLGSSSLLPIEGGKSDQAFVEALDGLVDFSDRNVVLKIDVEGFEARVVMGATKLLAERDCTLFVEKHADPRNEQRFYDMLRFLEENRYTAWHVTTPNGELSRIAFDAADKIPDVDMICFRRFNR